jgi:hypothetical protein
MSKGSCKNCRHWQRIKHWRNTGKWGKYQKIQPGYIEEGDKPSGDAFVSAPYGYEGTLTTGPDFSCVLFEAKGNSE